jgi:anti-sigma B factor antagonist
LTESPLCDLDRVPLGFTPPSGRGVLKLLNMTKRLNDLLILTKLATIFESFDSEEAAIASF